MSRLITPTTVQRQVIQGGSFKGSKLIFNTYEHNKDGKNYWEIVCEGAGEKTVLDVKKSKTLETILTISTDRITINSNALIDKLNINADNSLQTSDIRITLKGDIKFNSGITSTSVSGEFDSGTLRINSNNNVILTDCTTATPRATDNSNKLATTEFATRALNSSITFLTNTQDYQLSYMFDELDSPGYYTAFTDETIPAPNYTAGGGNILWDNWLPLDTQVKFDVSGIIPSGTTSIILETSLYVNMTNFSVLNYNVPFSPAGNPGHSRRYILWNGLRAIDQLYGGVGSLTTYGIVPVYERDDGVRQVWISHEWSNSDTYNYGSNGQDMYLRLKIIGYISQGV